MKIIHINDVLLSTLTADSTLITADSTLYTADQTHLSTDSNFIKIIPREFLPEVILEFYHEIKDERITETCIPTSQSGYMTIPFVYSGFEEGQSLEITVRNPDTNKIIWRGKGYVSSGDADGLQNYKMTPTTPPNDIIIL